MATKKTTPGVVAPAAHSYIVSDCTITNNSSANEHTRAAVEALANAVAENARAITAIAQALEGGGARMDAGIRLGS
jgi:seryl-tRNA(Sec) selenium transferase